MKERIFIVLDTDFIESEEDIFLIKADSRDHALAVYAKEYYAKLDFFKEEIERRTINMSFWEQFFFPTIYYEDNGTIKTDLSLSEIEIKFKENIEKYLGEKYKHFTSDLIDFFENEDKKIQELPEELVSYIAIKELQKEINSFIIKEITDICSI